MSINATPIAPGYYWAKLKTPSGGTLYNTNLSSPVHIQPEGESWKSQDWEIVHVWENNPMGDPKDDEFFGVSVFGVPVTQWVGDFFWGPRVADNKPSVVKIVG